MDYETEKKDFLSFLDNINVKPKEIGFNVDYKSDVKLNLTGKSMNIEGGWLSDIVKEDVEAAGEPQKRIN